MWSRIEVTNRVVCGALMLVYAYWCWCSRKSDTC